MLIKILFWILIAIDLAAVGLIFLLGLAAAGPSHTNPLEVIFLLAVLPAILILAAAAAFLFAKSTLLRAAAFFLAAAPLLIVILGPIIGGASYLYTSSRTREIEDAITRNDVTAIRAAAKGNIGTDALTLALRRIDKTKGNLEILKALLDAGADPNSAKSELPLAIAILMTPKLGIEPVQLLLNAKADPNKVDEFGTPAYFAATGPLVDVEVLKLVLDRGADVKLKTKDGRNALSSAVTHRKWKSAQLLIERGAEWKGVPALMGRTIQEEVENQARENPADPALTALRALLK